MLNPIYVARLFIKKESNLFDNRGGKKKISDYLIKQSKFIVFDIIKMSIKLYLIIKNGILSL